MNTYIIQDVPYIGIVIINWEVFPQICFICSHFITYYLHKTKQKNENKKIEEIM